MISLSFFVMCVECPTYENHQKPCVFIVLFELRQFFALFTIASKSVFNFKTFPDQTSMKIRPQDTSKPSRSRQRMRYRLRDTSQRKKPPQSASRHPHDVAKSVMRSSKAFSGTPQDTLRTVPRPPKTSPELPRDPKTLQERSKDP